MSETNANQATASTAPARRPTPEEIYARASAVPPEQWRDILLASLADRNWNGIPLPGFPPPEMQATFVGTSNEAALRSAYDFYMHVRKELELRAKPLGPASTVLDFGCGWGRLMRFFLRDVPWPQLFGFDPWSVAIELCRSTGVYGQLLKTNLLPPSICKEGSFDLIYAYSVFSHLSEKAAKAWIVELGRLLKPGGLLIVTTRGQNFLHHLRTLHANPSRNSHEERLISALPDPEALQEAMSAGHFFFTPSGASEDLGRDTYGHAAVPESYMARNWVGKAGLVLENFADSPGQPQAIATLRRNHA